MASKEKRLAGMGVIAVGLIAIGASGWETHQKTQDLARLTNVPQLVGPSTELDGRGQIPSKYRDPWVIRGMLLGEVFTNRAQEVAQWREEMGITPESIWVITPRPPEKEFTGLVVEKEGALLTDLPGKVLTENTPEERLIPRGEFFKFDYEFIINGKPYGVMVNTTYLGKNKDGEDIYGARPLFFEMENVRIVTNLPSRFPQAHSQIRASFSGRELPTAQTRLSSSSNRLSDANRFPRTKSSF